MYKLIHPKYPNGIEGLENTPVESHVNLEALSITSDSVVATAVLTPRDENIGAQIHWGDDTIDSIDFRKPVHHPDPTIPPGSFKLQHVYQKSAETGFFPNRVIVLVAVYSSGGRRTFDGAALDIEPRFRCTLYPTIVKATHHDTIFEEISEFDIAMRIYLGSNELLNRQWRWEPKTFDIDFGSTTVGIVAERMLAGSGVTTDIVLGGPSVRVITSYVDDDGTWGKIKEIAGVLTDIPSEFDTSVDVGLSIDPRYTEGPFSFTRTYGTTTEYFEFHISGSMDLVIPVDRGPVVAFE